jgi:hypothetical protein
MMTEEEFLKQFFSKIVRDNSDLAQDKCDVIGIVIYESMLNYAEKTAVDRELELSGVNRVI